MGFDDGRITLDSPNGAYYPGQTVNGKLTFQQDKVKTFRGIYVKIKGFCKVHWTTRETRTVNGKRESYTVTHESHEEYINNKSYLVGGESGEHNLQPGKHEFHFSFMLPSNCPSSFEGSHGHIRYEIKAVVDRAFKMDQEKRVAVRVVAPLDLNLDPYCKDPIQMEFSDSYCCFCIGSGNSNTTVKVPVAGFVPGQTIPIELSCANSASIDITNIKLSIRKKTIFTATTNPARELKKETLAEIKKGPITANTTRNWSVDMDVPVVDVYNLASCRYIDIEYTFKVIVNPSGCHSDTEGSRRLVLGTIPLVGYQDNVVNPLQDQMPAQVVPIIQQPLSSYNPYPGGNPPYPGGNPPYPGGNPPYPSGNPDIATYPASSPYPGASPYPPTNPPPYPGNASNPPYPTDSSYHSEKGNLVNVTPYPGNNSPFPAGNAPYPATSPYPGANPPNDSPYPGGNPPYPTNTSPYPVGNPPYPANNSPYPVGNPPYPVVSSPNPSGTSPYPGANPPYPTNSPYPPQQNVPYPGTPQAGIGNPSSNQYRGSLLKTGNIGFTIPPGQNSPISPMNPYSTASAPTIDSPDGLPK